MTDDQVVQQTRTAIFDMAIGDIQRASEGKAKLGAFILAACVIDYLSCLYKGKDGGATDYACFITKFFPAGYDGMEIYTSVRCGLVHNYTDKRHKYLYVDAQPALHLSTDGHGHIILNLENFVADLRRAADLYFAKVESDPAVKGRLIKRVDDVGIMGVGTITLPPTSASGTSMP